MSEEREKALEKCFSPNVGKEPLRESAFRDGWDYRNAEVEALKRDAEDLREDRENAVRVAHEEQGNSIRLERERDEARAVAAQTQHNLEYMAQRRQDAREWVSELQRELSVAREALERQTAYSITLQRAIEALARGGQLPPKELSPHVLGLAGDVVTRLVVAEGEAKAAASGRDFWKRSCEQAEGALEKAREMLSNVTGASGEDEAKQFAKWGLEDSALAPQPSTVPARKCPNPFCAENPNCCPAKPTVEPARECNCHLSGGVPCPVHVVGPAKPTVEEKTDPPLHTCWRSLYDPPTKERDCDGCRAELEPTAEEKPEPHRARHSIKDFWCPAGVCETCCATCFRCAHNGHEGTCPQGLRARAEAAEKSLETANGLLRRMTETINHPMVSREDVDNLLDEVRAHLSLKGAK